MKIAGHISALIAASSLGGTALAGVILIGAYTTEQRAEELKETQVVRELAGELSERVDIWVEDLDAAITSGERGPIEHARDRAELARESIAALQQTAGARSIQSTLERLNGLIEDLSQESVSRTRTPELLKAFDQGSVDVLRLLERARSQLAEDHSRELASAERNRQRTRRGTIGAALVYLLLISAAWQWSRWTLVAPVERLTRATRRALDEDRPLTVEPRGPEEVRTLAEAFGELAKSLEWRVEERTEQLERASRVKNEFLAMMSHELRTPMNGVIGMVDLLLQTDLDAEQIQQAQTVRLSAESLLTMLADILDVTKMESGQLTIEPSPFGLHDLLASVTDLQEPVARNKGLTLSAEIAQSVPTHLLGDPGRIRQVLVNLVGNAIKFTERGSVAIAVSCELQGESAAVLHFSVKDEGIGIPEDQLETVFEKFTQVDSSITRRHGGSGIGLAISKQLVELMDGKIGVGSVEGKGSTFWFRITLPLHEPPEARPIEPGREETPDRFDASVLVIEDEPVNQMIARRLLQKLGCRVEVAPDGIEGLAALEAGEYDLIFMDCQMPRMDGFETTRRIRSGGSHASIPIVALTANAMKGDRERCLEAGMDDFLSKPTQLHVLRSALARWIGKSPAA